MITDLFCHKCDLSRVTPGGVDEYGIPTSPTTVTVAGIACRYVRAKSVIKTLESGIHVFRQPAVLLPAGTDVREGDTIAIKLTDPGVASEYHTGPVHPAYDDLTLHHLRVELEAV